MKFKNLILTILFVLLTTVPCLASSVALQWDANTESDLAGYKIYYVADLSSFDTAIILDVKNVTTYTIANLDPSKAYSIALKAYNIAGMESAFSNVVTIPELTSPVVTISEAIPLNNALTVSASATDNVGVTKVEFYINGKLVNTATAIPYKYVAALPSLSSGNCVIMVKAYDAAGNVGMATKTITLPVSPVSPKNIKWTITIAGS